MTERTSEDSFDINSLDEIRDVVERAVEGAAAGDRAKLRGAFHPDAWMFGETEGERHDAPIGVLFELCEKHPLRKDENYRWRVLSITRVGGGAMAMVVSSRNLGPA